MRELDKVQEFVDSVLGGDGTGWTVEIMDGKDVELKKR